MDVRILSSVTAQSSDASLPIYWFLAPFGAVVALIFAYYFYTNMMKEDEGNDTMKEIAQAIREGAMAYLQAQWRTVGRVFIGLFVLFIILAMLDAQEWLVAVAFLTAGFFSGVAGYIGMRTATNASARTAWAASKSLNDGLRVAFRGGAVMGMSVVGFALLDMSIWFLLLKFVIFPEADAIPKITTIMLSAAVGASTMALFGRVGGGIYTKAADVGADLVGKVEAGIPEDDPRNPATIADNVGDNVGDVAGMGADLYESYAASILAAASLGVSAVVAVGGTATEQLAYLAAPFMLAGTGVLMSIIGVFLVRTKEDASMQDLMKKLEGTVQISSVLIALLSIPLLMLLNLSQHSWWQVWVSVVTGLLVGISIGRVTEYFTSAEYKPTQGIAYQANTGPGTVIIDGLAVGMRSTGMPVLIVVLGTAVSFYVSGGADSTLNGLFGVGISAVGMLATLGLTLATDAYGPIADNAGGNAEMSGLDPKVRERTDQLDALGNTTAATGKGFAIGSAALTGLALLAAYLETIRTSLIAQGVVNLPGSVLNVATMSMSELIEAFHAHPLNPMFLLGLFIGAMVAFYFSAMTMSAVGRSAFAMVEEVRRQFRENPGILDGTVKPEYARCVEISTDAALKEMVNPSLLAIVVPIVVGVVMGVPGVLGLLAGGLSSAFALAIMMANSGGAWDNAKKYIEEGHHGGKGSEAHKAAVVGDTVGDPFKDTSGPSLNILIKLMSMVSVVMAGLVVLIGNGFGLISLLF
ncbi:MAG: sodium-translocating pyrophosphatase [Candidatus Promineifilaceae bacterium]